MTRHEQRVIRAMKRLLADRSANEIVPFLLGEGLLDMAAVERRMIRDEVARRVRGGERKMRAIEEVAYEMNCSYEKARAAVYRRPCMRGKTESKTNVKRRTNDDED